MFSKKKYQNTLFSTYFRVLIIIEILILLLRIDFFIKEEDLTSLRLISEFFCKFTMYSIYSTQSMSSWITVLISLDRFVSIVKPTRFLFRKKLLFQLAACSLAIIYNLIFSIHILISYKFEYVNKTNKKYIVPKCRDKNMATDYIETINSSLIPFILMMILTLLTLNIVIKSRKMVQNNQQSLSKKDIRFAITSIGLNVSFFILKFPQGFYLILKYYIYINDDINSLIYKFLSILMYAQNGSVFYLTFLTNRSFKKEFFKSFRTRRS